MSASTQAAPRQMSFGRFPGLAMLALVAILAVAIALVVLNGTKAAATPVTDGAKAAPPPAVIDHGWSNGETTIVPPYYGPFYRSTIAADRLDAVDHGARDQAAAAAAAAKNGTQSFGGFGGPRLVPETSKGAGQTGPRLRPQ